MQVRVAYNAKHTASILRDSDRFYSSMAEKILARVRKERHGQAQLLDVGCGGGYLLREVVRHGSSVLKATHGLEISDMALREARRQSPQSRLVLGQGERLPYPQGHFDAVVCLGNLEHFMDPAAGARELARVCRRDGVAWILLPNSYYSGSLWRVILTGYGPNHHQVIDRFATINEWRDLLEANQLCVDSIEPYNRFKWWKRLLPRNLAYHFLYSASPSIGSHQENCALDLKVQGVQVDSTIQSGPLPADPPYGLHCLPPSDIP